MLKQIVNNKQALVGLIMIGIVIIVMIIAPLISPNSPVQGDLSMRFAKRSINYPLGGDQLGRCNYTRLIYGTRYSIGIAIPVLILTAILSIVTGTIAAYYKGIVDQVFVAICDIGMAFPPMIIVLTLVGSLGKSIANLIIAIVFALWFWNAKIVRSFVLVESHKKYVLAAKISGSSNSKIILKHIIPNIMPSLVVFFSLSISDIIIMISSFSFLGLGVESSLPEWGSMISIAKKFIYSKPYMALYPGFCIFFTAIGFNIFGEALRDINAIDNKVKYEKY